MKRGLISAFLIVAVIGFSTALVDVNSESLVKDYSGGETIKGEIRVDLEGENADSLLTSNFKGNISLIEIIRESGLAEGEDYTCSLYNCINRYLEKDSVNVIELDGEETLGLRAAGDVNSIEELSFSVKSSSESCGVPVFVDVLGDGKNLVTSDNYVNSSCFGNNYGCFDRSLDQGEYENAVIIEDFYCEDIVLLPGAAYRAGAFVQRGQGTEGLEMQFFDKEGDDIGFCVLPDINQSSQDLECTIEYNNPYEKEVSACIRDLSASGHEIRTESSGEVCGSSNLDFEIFARPLKFGNVNLTIDNNNFLDPGFSSIEDYAFDYLKRTYGTENGEVVCDPSCIIPVKFTGGGILEINDISFIYKTGDVAKSSKNIFDLDIEKAKINARDIDLDVEKAGFVIPLGSNEDSLKLFVEGDEILDEEIDISEGLDFDITPKFIFIGRDTEFRVIADGNITYSKWNFQNVVKESTSNVIRHRYNAGGNYEIDVEVRREDGAAARKNFKIIVGEPKKSANLTISDYESRISRVKGDLNSFSAWEKEKIINKTRLLESEAFLEKLKFDFDNADSESDYIDIINKLIALNIPNSVSTSKRGALPIEIGLANVDTGLVEELSREKSDDEEVLRNRIIGWMNENYGGSIEFKIISARIDDKVEDILSVYKISLEKKGSESGFLFINYPMESIAFKEEYGQTAIGGGAYIPVVVDEMIEFIIEGEISADEIGAYVSPRISELGTLEEYEQEDDRFKLGGFTFWMILLITATLAIYITLQEWYKKHYENYLFKDKNELYNLINFIYNSRVGGFEDSQIRDNLKEKDWDGEKITYAFNKIDGKRTGMFEIPIFKIFENKKVKKEIQSRQKGKKIDSRFIRRRRPVRKADARFIKRPGYGNR